MPLIEVHLLEGRTDEQKKALLQEITRAVHESIGIFTERIYGCRRTLRRQKMKHFPALGGTSVVIIPRSGPWHRGPE